MTAAIPARQRDYQRTEGNPGYILLKEKPQNLSLQGKTRQPKEVWLSGKEHTDDGFVYSDIATNAHEARKITVK